MQPMSNTALRIAGAAMFAAAALHAVAIFAGPAFVAALGVPADIVRSAAQGTALAPIVISLIAAFLAAVGWYAFSLAGGTRQLPFSRPLLGIVGAILLLRGLALPLLLLAAPAIRSRVGGFEVAVAILCCVLGVLFFIGVRQPGLRPEVAGS